MRTSRVSATGVALNLGKPNMPLCCLALLPNVVGASLGWSQVIGLATIICWWTDVIGGPVLLAVRARRQLQTPRIVRGPNRIAGGASMTAITTVAIVR